MIKQEEDQIFLTVIKYKVSLYEDENIPIELTKDCFKWTLQDELLSLTISFLLKQIKKQNNKQFLCCPYDVRSLLENKIKLCLNTFNTYFNLSEEQMKEETRNLILKICQNDRVKPHLLDLETFKYF